MCMAFENTFVTAAGGAEMTRSDNEFAQNPLSPTMVGHATRDQRLREIARRIVLATLEDDRRMPELDSPPLGLGCAPS